MHPPAYSSLDMPPNPPSLNSSQDSDTENDMPVTAEMSETKITSSSNGNYASNPFDENEANVFVLFQYGKAPLKYCRPRVNEATTVHQIKNELFVEWGIPITAQQLMVNNAIELLDNSKTLKEYGIDISNPCRLILNTNIEIVETETQEMQEQESSPLRPTYGPVMYGTSPSRNYGGHASDSENEIDLYDKRPQCDLVGLKNQGATCYLNSLIQMLYLTPEFRRMIYQIPRPYEFLLKENDEEAKDAKENESIKENDKEEKETTDSENKPDRKTDIIFQMQLLFARMQYSNLSSVSTSGLTTSFGWDNSDIFVQHDVQELNRVLCDNIEEKMKGKEGEYSISKLYKGIMLNMIKCTNCNRVSTREEDYYDISLVIKDKKNILESFEEFTTVEKMENENAYFCERCNSKQTAEKSIKFKTVPKILNLQLKRFEFDWNTNMRVKIHDEVGFPAELDLSKYMVDSDLMEQLNKEKQNEEVEMQDVQADSLQYELIGVLVHTGNAGFGHYYAFIKHFVDGKWYKFNDEHVTPVDESDILAQNWIGGSTSSYSWTSNMMQRSATPYMLVYRKQIPPAPVASTDSNEASTTMEEDQEDTSSFSINKKRRSLGDFRAPPVNSSEIPSPILEYLMKEQEKRENKRKEKEKELASCTITVFRNRVELPIKVVKVDRNITMEELRSIVIADVACESSDKYYYRFRRVANRKNHTKRPMQCYAEEDYQKSISDTNIAIDKKNCIYLEQDTDPSFPDLNEDITDDNVFISMRFWSKELRRPSSIRDFIFPKSMTLGQIKSILSKNYVPLAPEDMIIVEEETEKIINIMPDDNNTLKSYNIISGDILHVEPSSKEHILEREKGEKPFSFTQLYYQEKRNKLVVDILETNNSYKRRMALEGGENKDIKDIKKVKSSDKPEDWKNLKIGFQVSTNKTHTLRELKNVIALKLEISPYLLRIYDTDSIGYGSEQGRLLKDSTSKLGSVLVKYGKISTHLGLEILEHEEDLQKGDKLIKTRYYNANHDFESVLEVKINKKETFRDLKTKLREKVGIPEDMQVISEWYNEHFYKLFANDKETIAQARIRKMDILRVDVLTDSLLNPSLNFNTVNQGNIIAFQLVNFIAWDTTSYGRKEMQTSFPTLLTVPDDISLFELRYIVAARVGIPWHNINIATSSNFPILEGYITPIKDLVKQAGEDHSVPLKFKDSTQTSENEIDEDPDDVAIRLAIQENNGEKAFNFKSEKKVSLKKLRLRQLDIICWEDLRKKPDKPAQAPSVRSKKNRDGEDLKIKN